MDVAGWLQDLGLERYVPAFRDNEIDSEALPKLTAEDLKDRPWCSEATAASSSPRLPRSAPRCPPPR